jgi:uncharacterized damage-inducible protein DinB
VANIDVFIDGFSRVNESTHRAVEGLSEAQLAARLDPDANSIGWLVWHLSRISDDHIADAAGREQVWLSDGWAERFGFPFDRYATGYGQSSHEVAEVHGVDVEQLLGYHDAVHEQTLRFLRGASDAELDRVVDVSYDPPVTLAVRLVSVISDGLQHAGQAAFIRGIVLRR